MPDWIVECGETDLQDTSRGELYQLCVQTKFRGMQYAVLGLFQGYLAQLPLQHRHFLFLASVQHHSISLLNSINNLSHLQGNTIIAQRTALRSFESSSHRLLTAIETYLDPIVRFLPTIESANNITSELERQLVHMDDISQTFSAILLVFIPLGLTAALVLLGWMNRIPLAFLIPTFGVIWSLKRAALLTTSWSLFSLILAYFIFQSIFGAMAKNSSKQHKESDALKEKESIRSKQWNALLAKAKEAWLA